MGVRRTRSGKINMKISTFSSAFGSFCVICCAFGENILNCVNLFNLFNIPPLLSGALWVWHRASTWLRIRACSIEKGNGHRAEEIPSIRNAVKPAPIRLRVGNEMDDGESRGPWKWKDGFSYPHKTVDIKNQVFRSGVINGGKHKGVWSFSKLLLHATHRLASLYDYVFSFSPMCAVSCLHLKLILHSIS